MTNIQTQQDLHVAILRLEQQQLLERHIMKQHYQETLESMQPINILKNIAVEINNTDQLKKDLLKAAVALAIGFIAKKIFESYTTKSKNKIVSAIGITLQLIVTNWIDKHRLLIKEISLHFFKLILNKKQILLQEADATKN